MRRLRPPRLSLKIRSSLWYLQEGMSKSNGPNESGCPHERDGIGSDTYVESFMKENMYMHHEADKEISRNITQ